LNRNKFFSHCNSALSWDQTADLAKTVASLQELQDFKLINELVLNEQENGFDGLVKLYMLSSFDNISAASEFTFIPSGT